jgi:malate dehydrogenase (oxaloacetate-decarboxylating)(NADP+)
MTDKALNYH